MLINDNKILKMCFFILSEDMVVCNLIQIKCFLYLFFNNFSSMIQLTFKQHVICGLSGNFSFIQSYARRFMVFNGTFNNISRQLNIVTTRTTALGMYSVVKK